VLDVIGDVNLNLLGYLVVGLFVATWALALAVWRFGRIEQRWSAAMRQP
jgi:high-affinity nickel-transport protein